MADAAPATFGMKVVYRQYINNSNNQCDTFIWKVRVDGFSDGIQVAVCLPVSGNNTVGEHVRMTQVRSEKVRRKYFPVRILEKINYLYRLYNRFS